MTLVLHATTVAVDGRGLLIMGASGSGKSSLALQMIALGAELVADDRTGIALHEDALVASCPATIRGLIEAWGMGLLSVPSRQEARLCLAVDLDRTETERLPPHRIVTVLGRDLPLVLAQRSPHFPAGLILRLRYLRKD